MLYGISLGVRGASESGGRGMSSQRVQDSSMKEFALNQILAPNNLAIIEDISPLYLAISKDISPQ